MTSNTDGVLPIRRVVTGETPDGKSVFTHVEEVEPLQVGGLSWYGVWGWDEVPALPFYSPDAYRPASVFPGANPGAARVQVVVFPPGQGVVKRPAGETSEEYRDLLARVPAGGIRDPETGMHSTSSIDLTFVLEGEIGLEQTDGAEVTLRRGDVLVQNGAYHAWRNRSDEACVVAFVVLGANRDDDTTGA